MIWLAMRQVFNQYTGSSKLAFIFTLLEPLIIILGLYAIRGILKAKTPNYGTSLFLFYASGFLPFYLFLRISIRARSANTDPRNRLPGLSALDQYIATVGLNSLIWITVMVFIFYAMWLYGIQQARPASIVDCVVPVVLFIVLGTGVGMINNVISRYFSFWNRLYGILTRGIMFMTGVLVIVDFYPPLIRQWVILNPLSHGIEWFRIGVYGPQYPHIFLDKWFLIKCTFIVLFIGLVVDRAALRSLGNR